jgi:transposase
MAGGSLRDISKELNIKLSSSKFILRKFKKNGKVLKKKCDKDAPKRDRELEQLH